ncbi:Ribosome maturation factor RimP [Acaryochloris thomasi RCC1774]|uniref:Ribosome maturation factor RimP n=1 Tax=Acaryochloris thomasi RCC1774 TaxID=1764569 RepID=A0A2W1J8Q2_9CYAN|nr:ribosome maturation factor RimP [Acaryochloris thomasi]PZD70516.1 Ribosome maturation factor RimP [Acaryochloris thomasi RCC1774]
MSHPVIPQVLALAKPVAKALELEIVDAVYHTHQQPPTLRVDVRSCKEDTNLEDCERMSRSLETALDEADVMPEAYVLEISSPGVSEFLTQDRDFTAFRSFPVAVQTNEPFKGHQVWTGTLTSRDQDWIHLNQKGRSVSIPRALVSQVQLQDPP